MAARKNKRRTNPRTYSLERIAVHEAGHAVAAVLFKMGSSAKGATIIPDKNYAGCVWHKKHPVSFRPDVDTGRVNELRIRRSVCFCLAGLAAERVEYGPHIKTVGAWMDFDHAESLVSYVSGSPDETSAWLNLLSIQIENTLRVPHNHRAVRLVADELLKERQINYATIRRLVAQARSSS